MRLAAMQRDFNLAAGDSFFAQNANAMIVERFPFAIRVAAPKEIEFVSARWTTSHAEPNDASLARLSQSAAKLSAS